MKVLMQIKPCQLGCSMRCWKEAKSKIDKVPHSQARSALLNYIAKMETMGLPIPKTSVDLKVKIVGKPVKKCRKVDQNCKHIKPHRECYFWKFHTKLSHNVAMGVINQEQPMVKYNTVHLQLSCRWLTSFDAITKWWKKQIYLTNIFDLVQDLG